MITDPLLFRYLTGEATGQENSQVDEWLASDPANASYLSQLRDYLENSGNERFEGETLAAWLRLSGRLDQKSPKPNQPATVRMKFFLPAAALLLLLISSGLFFHLRNEARVIRNNELTTRLYLLPDGTQVYLGPGSRIIRSREFNQELREIRLTGQAFFDVRPDPERPFLVLAGDTRVEVSGTRFSITAPKKTGEVEVSVHSGEVLFYNSQIVSKNSFRMGLGPGDMGIYSPTLRRMDKTRDPLYYSAP